MTVEAVDLMWFALFSGIGAGIGNPIGQAIYKKIIKPHAKKIIEHSLETLKR